MKAWTTGNVAGVGTFLATLAPGITCSRMKTIRVTPIVIRIA